MRILCGVNGGLVKEVDTISRRVTRLSAPRKLHRKLNVTSMVFTNSHQDHYLMTRECGLLELQPLGKAKEKPIIAFIPPKPLLVDFVAEDTICVVCRSGRLLLIDLPKLIESNGDQLPPVPENHTLEEVDWRLAACRAMSETVYQGVITEHLGSGAAQKKPGVESPPAYVKVVYDLGQDLEAATVVDIDQKRYLLVGGPSLQLTILCCEEGSTLRVMWKAQVMESELALEEPANIKSVGLLGVVGDYAWVHSINNRGIMSIYPLSKSDSGLSGNELPMLQIQTTLDTNCPTIFASLPNRADVDPELRRAMYQKAMEEEMEKLKKTTEATTGGETDRVSGDEQPEKEPKELPNPEDVAAPETSDGEAETSDGEDDSELNIEASDSEASVLDVETSDSGDASDEEDEKDGDEDEAAGDEPPPVAEVPESELLKPLELPEWKKKGWEMAGQDVELHFCVGDARGAARLFHVGWVGDEDHESVRKRRKLDDDLRQYYMKTKRASHARTFRRYYTGEVISSPSADTPSKAETLKKQIRVAVRSGFKRIPGAIVGIVASPSFSRVIILSLDGRLYILNQEATSFGYSVEHKVSLDAVNRSINVLR